MYSLQFDLLGRMHFRIYRKYLSSSKWSWPARCARSSGSAVELAEMDLDCHIPNDCGDHLGQDFHLSVHPAHPGPHT